MSEKRKSIRDRQTDERVAIYRMNYLRGLFAIMIVLGHCSMQFEHELFPLMLIHKFNMVSVCFFFIVSGWSLTYNFYNKDNYLKGFIVNKPLRLFIFAFLCEIVARILNCVIFQKAIKIDVGLLTNYNWYVYEIIVFYVMFYIAYKINCNKNIRMIFIVTVSLVVSVFTWYMSNHAVTFWGHAFHFSSLCFAWGIVIHEYYDVFLKLLKRRVTVSILLLFCGLISCISLKMPQGSFIGGVILHNMVGICVMSIIAIWAHFIDYRKIPIVGWLTKYSTEIYLYQFMILGIFAELYKRWNHDIDLLYVGLVVIFTLVLAVIMYYADEIISKGISCVTK